MDQGSNLVSQYFKSAVEAEGITLLEAPGGITSKQCPHVERYHLPLRSVYSKIKCMMPGATRVDILSMAVKFVNDTVGPEGLSPTLLVFGCIPKPARNVPTSTQRQRAEALQSVTKELAKIYASTRVKFGLKHKGPVGNERTDLDDLFPGSLVLIYRTKSKSWEGPIQNLLIRLAKQCAYNFPVDGKFFGQLL